MRRWFVILPDHKKRVHLFLRKALGKVWKQRQLGEDGGKRLYCGFHRKEWVK